MPLNTGIILNKRYRIVSLLGKGGFGAVYRAWDLNLNRACAVKENLDTSPEAQKQFGREATLLANLSHPNLVRVIDYFLIPGQGQYFIMDFIEGQDLEQMVKAKGALPVEQVLGWAEQICAALQYLHTQEPPIIHRDIKPANIKITPQGKAVLVDFGIAKIFDPELRTTQGARAVTPGFSPPEQYGQGSTDHRTDIYALGATLYTTLTGVIPPDSVDILTGSVPAPDQANLINPSIPTQIGQALVKATRLNRIERFTSMAEFSTALVPIATQPAAVGYLPLPPAETAPAPPLTTNQGIPKQYQRQAGPEMPSAAIGIPGAAQPPAHKRKIPWAWAVAGGIIGLAFIGWAIFPQQPKATPPPESMQATEEGIVSVRLPATDEITPIEGVVATEISEPCAPASEGALVGVDPRGQTVVWWHNHNLSREEGLARLITEFNSTNECGITINPQNQGGYNDIRDRMNAGIATGELPGLVVGYQNDQAFYALASGLVNINPYMTDPYWGLTGEVQADFYATFLQQSVHPAFDNMRLGFPPNRSIEIMYYNQTWLEELGFSSPPSTPNEFREMACAAAAANGDGSGGYILRDDASSVTAWTMAFGGEVLNEDGTGYVYNGQATIDAMRFQKALLDDGCAFFFTEGYPNTEFASRRAIFTTGSSSGIPYYAADIATVASQQGREADVWGIAAIPHTTTDPVINVYGGDVMIPVTTPEIQLAAWIFIKWYTSPEIQAQWAQISGYFPTRASTWDYMGDYVSAHTQYGQAIDLLQFGAFEPQLISYQSVRDSAQEAFYQIMQGAPLVPTLDILTEEANALQAELMSP